MNPHTPKGTPTLGVGVPVDFRIFRKWLQGSKLIGLRRSLYHWKKLLERRCLKWACMTHLDIWNTSFGRKKGWESNWQFDSRPLKVGNRSDFLVWRWCATYRWKAPNEGYNFSLELILIWGLKRKLWAPKVTGVPSLKILGLSLWSPGTKCHLDVDLMEKHIVYYKGEGGGFPQVRAMVSLVSLNLPVIRFSTKSAQTMH
jgi:hypothetical protein